MAQLLGSGPWLCGRWRFCSVLLGAGHTAFGEFPLKVGHTTDLENRRESSTSRSTFLEEGAIALRAGPSQAWPAAPPLLVQPSPGPGLRLSKPPPSQEAKFQGSAVKGERYPSQSFLLCWVELLHLLGPAHSHFSIVLSVSSQLRCSPAGSSHWASVKTNQVPQRDENFPSCQESFLSLHVASAPSYTKCNNTWLLGQPRFLV